MTAPEWVTLIAAVSAALVSVIGALKASGAQAQAREAKAEAQAVRIQMNEPVVPGGLPPGMSTADIFKYWDLAHQVVTLVKSFGHAEVGESVVVPAVKFDVPGHGRWAFPPTRATKER